MALAKKCDACKSFYDFIETENEANGRFVGLTEAEINQAINP